MLTTKKHKQPKRIQRQSNYKLQPVNEKPLTFIEHTYELRRRFGWVVGTLLITSIIAYFFHEQLVSFVVMPLHGSKLIYLTPGGGFNFVFTICLYFGALVSIPVVIYHVYRFLQPLIGRASSYFIMGIISTSILLAVLGLAFGYLLVIPGMIHFLGEFAGSDAVPSLTTDSYLNFLVMHLFGMALLFQLPLLLFISDHVHPLPPGTLLKLQRWVLGGSVIAAAMITPTPDPISLGLVALPIIMIYELGVLIVWLRRRPHYQELAQIKASSPMVRSVEIAPLLPSLERNVAVSSKPVTRTQPAIPNNIARHPRSVDGFKPATHTTTPPRPAATPSQVPVSPTGASPAALLRQSSLHRHRSIDGFLVA